MNTSCFKPLNNSLLNTKKVDTNVIFCRYSNNCNLFPFGPRFFYNTYINPWQIIQNNINNNFVLTQSEDRLKVTKDKKDKKSPNESIEIKKVKEENTETNENDVENEGKAESKLFLVHKINQKLGRKKNGEANVNCKKTNKHFENIIVKIKTHFFISVYKLCNDIIKYEEKLYTARKDIYLVKINKTITGQIEMERTKNYLFNGTILDLYYNEEVNQKVQLKDKNKNKNTIDYLIRNKRILSLMILNLKLIDIYNLYKEDKKPIIEGVTDPNLIHILNSFMTVSEDAEKMQKERKGIDKAYMDMFKDTAKHYFITYYFTRSGRVKKKTKK